MTIKVGNIIKPWLLRWMKPIQKWQVLYPFTRKLPLSVKENSLDIDGEENLFSKKEWERWLKDLDALCEAST
jgi:hypothetical protein